MVLGRMWGMLSVCGEFGSHGGGVGLHLMLGERICALG